MDIMIWGPLHLGGFCGRANNESAKEGSLRETAVRDGRHNSLREDWNRHGLHVGLLSPVQNGPLTNRLSCHMGNVIACTHRCRSIHTTMHVHLRKRVYIVYTHINAC